MTDPEPTGGFADAVAAALSAEITPRRAEMRRAATALKRIIDRFVATKAPTEELTRAADALELVAAGLAPWPQGRNYEGFAESGPAGDPHAFFDNSPVMGKANPLATHLDVDVVDGVVVATAVFGAAYEGPPGCVHGGHVAAAFDEVLGMAQSLTGNHGMTGTLTVRYRQPTPLHQVLRFEGELLRTEGRKIFTAGRCYRADGTLTAEAEGLFITIDTTKIAELFDTREAQEEQDVSG